MGNVIVFLLISIAFFGAVKRIAYDRRSGKSMQCGGDCRKCSGCH